MRIMGLMFTGKSIVCSVASTGKNKREQQGSALLPPCEEKPPETNGISSQRASSAKSVHLAIPVF